MADSTQHRIFPTDPKERKTFPVFSGVLKYFPDAIAAVSHVSYVGNEQHNPGEPLHWARGKSMDQEDTLLRHLMEAGSLDSDGIRHSAKVVWRALAMLQLEIEGEQKIAKMPRPCPPRTKEGFKEVCNTCGETFGAHIGIICPYQGLSDTTKEWS